MKGGRTCPAVLQILSSKSFSADLAISCARLIATMTGTLMARPCRDGDANTAVA